MATMTIITPGEVETVSDIEYMISVIGVAFDMGYSFISAGSAGLTLGKMTPDGLITCNFKD